MSNINCLLWYTYKITSVLLAFQLPRIVQNGKLMYMHTRFQIIYLHMKENHYQGAQIYRFVGHVWLNISSLCQISMELGLYIFCLTIHYWFVTGSAKSTMLALIFLALCFRIFQFILFNIMTMQSLWVQLVDLLFQCWFYNLLCDIIPTLAWPHFAKK